MVQRSAPEKFTTVSYVEPHKQRTRDILKAHPELKSLYGNYPLSALYITGLVALQYAIAILIKDQSIWLNLLVAWTVGAIANHALWTLIHDATHNLVFKSAFANRLLAVFANFPIAFPGAISFRTFHLMHHKYQGIEELDADLAIDIEAKLAGNNPIGKSLWLLFFFVFQPLRVQRLKRIQLIDKWVIFNWFVVVTLMTFMVLTFGWYSFLYLFFSSAFSVGFHPVGARWIQEHYVTETSTNQETYSYYGPLNRLAFNVGYHNEHHDLPFVAWRNLPKIRAGAPEFYNSLVSYPSWTKLWLRFIFDPSLSLHSRIVRKEAVPGKVVEVPVPAPAEA
jgi:sphingolipid 4-desaturase/C4-monooxygenase